MSGLVERLHSRARLWSAELGNKVAPSDSIWWEAATAIDEAIGPLQQYISDMRHPILTEDQRERRIAYAEAALAKLRGTP